MSIFSTSDETPSDGICATGSEQIGKPSLLTNHVIYLTKFKAKPNPEERADGAENE